VSRRNSEESRSKVGEGEHGSDGEEEEREGLEVFYFGR